MSLIPPNLAVLSKINHYLQKNLPEGLLPVVMDKLGPFPVFRLKVAFRSTNPPSPDYVFLEAKTPELTENFSGLSLFPNRDPIDRTVWDCIDTAMNTFTRTKFLFLQFFQGVGTLQIVLEGKRTPNLSDSSWSQIYKDEIPFFPKISPETALELEELKTTGKLTPKLKISPAQGTDELKSSPSSDRDQVDPSGAR